MALPFGDSGAKKRRDQMVAVDLGGRTTKAVYIQRRGDNFALCRYVVMDAPIFEKTLPVELLSEHLKALSRALDCRCKWLTLTLGVSDSLVRHVEMPPMPTEDMRLVLKNNSRVYLQQDMSGNVFDCEAATPAPQAKSKDAGKNGPAQQKQKVLVASAKSQLIDDFVLGARNSGFIPDHILPGVFGPINSFEKALPEVFEHEAVALVDIGFKSSSISILKEKDLILNRVVAIGGDRLTAGLAESMNISYAEAEGIKIGMASEVQAQLEPLLTPLGRELRASLDFFEHQHDRPVSQVFLSGGSSRSEYVVETLKRELMAECKTWNPTASLKMALSPEQSAEIEHVAPQLTVAIGAAYAAF